MSYNGPLHAVLLPVNERDLKHDTENVLVRGMMFAYRIFVRTNWGRGNAA